MSLPEQEVIIPWLHTAQSTQLDPIYGLIDILKAWYQVPDLSAETIRRSVELIHVSSLMLDDLEERLPLRNKKPAAYIVYGTGQTIKSCKLMTIRGIKELAKLGNARCMRILLGELITTSLSSHFPQTTNR